MAETQPAAGAYVSPDAFERMIGELHGLPDVTFTRATALQVVMPLSGATLTYIIRTYRQQERGDTISLTYVDGQKSVRVALPPAVANCIARQRESLGKITRRRSAKEQMAARKAKGWKPSFKKKGGE